MGKCTLYRFCNVQKDRRDHTSMRANMAARTQAHTTRTLRQQHQSTVYLRVQTVLPADKFYQCPTKQNKLVMHLVIFPFVSLSPCDYFRFLSFCFLLFALVCFANFVSLLSVMCFIFYKQSFHPLNAASERQIRGR